MSEEYLKLKEIKKRVYDLGDSKFLKKTKYDWRIIHSYRKDIGKNPTLSNIHWKHATIGTWGNLFRLIIIITLLVFLSWSYARDTKECRAIIEDPITFCGNAVKTEHSNIPIPDLQREVTILNGADLFIPAKETQ